MESANGDRIISTELSNNEDTDNDIQPSLSICCSEKSYEQCSPPVCYVELAGHKDQQSLAKSSLKLIPGAETSDTTNADTTYSTSSTTKSGIFVKDGDSVDCASPETIVPSSVVHDQKNVITLSVPSPLMNTSCEDLSEGRLVIVERNSIDDEDVDAEERPLVVDLGDSPGRSDSRKLQVVVLMNFGALASQPLVFVYDLQAEIQVPDKEKRKHVAKLNCDFEASKQSEIYTKANEEKVSDEKAGGVFRKPSNPANKPSPMESPSTLPPPQSPRDKTQDTTTKDSANSTKIPTLASNPVTTSSILHYTSAAIPVTSQSTSVVVTTQNSAPSVMPTSTHSHPPPNSAPRLQKPIRPFLPPASQFIPPPPPLIEIGGSRSSTSITLAPQSAPQFLTSAPSLTGTSTTFRLQPPPQPPQLAPSNIHQQSLQPQPLTNLSGPVVFHHQQQQQQQQQHQQSGGGNNGNVQFMSLLTHSPSHGPGGVQHSPIQLFNLAPMSGYLNPSTGLLFHSIPSAVGGGANGGGNQPGTFHFAPPPPPTLFASHHHQQQQTAYHSQPTLPQQHQQNFATRPNGPSSATGSASSLPPPPPLAPAPGLSSLQSRTTGGNSTPMTGVFIPDMNSWMASVTGSQGMMPPLQPFFSCQQPPVSISGAGGESLTVSAANNATSVPTTTTAITAITLTTPVTSLSQPSLSSQPNPQPTDPPPPRPTSTPISTPTTQASEKTSVPVIVNGSTFEKPVPPTSESLPPNSSNLSISARRWRPSSSSSERKAPSDQTASSTEKPPVSKENPVTDQKLRLELSSGTESTIPMTCSEKVAGMLEQPGNDELKNSSHEPNEKLNAEMLKEDAQKAPRKEEKESKREKSIAAEAEINQTSVPSTSKARKISRNHRLSRKKKTQRQSPAPNVSAQSPSTTPSAVASQRKIISHFIDGHVLYESNLPFPVRNATSFVKEFLQQCNGNNKPRDVATNATTGTISPSTESICATSTTANVVSNNDNTSKNRNEGEDENELELDRPQQRRHRIRSKDVEELIGGNRITMTTIATKTPRLKVSSTNASRKRRRLDVEPPRTEEEEVKKNRKKSILVTATPSTSTALPSQNGHKEHPISVNDSKSAASSDVRPATTAVPVQIPITASSGVGGSLKMTIHPVYQDSCEKSTINPVSLPSSSPPSSPTPLQPIISSPPSSPDPPTAVSQTPVSTKQPPQPIHHSTPAAPIVVKLVAAPQSSTAAMPPPPPLPPGPMSKWTPRAVAEFVRGTSGCASYADAFEINEVDGEALILLSSSTSNFIAPPLSMKIGHALKLANRVKTITSSSVSYTDTTSG